MSNFTTPDAHLPDYGFSGSMQQILSMNLGETVICEFLVGTGSLVQKSGDLYYVDEKYIVLWDRASANYVVCDIFSLRFVTFLTFAEAPQEQNFNRGNSANSNAGGGMNSNMNGAGGGMSNNANGAGNVMNGAGGGMNNNGNFMNGNMNSNMRGYGN